MRRRTWIDKLKPGLRERVDAEIDARSEPDAYIFARWNLIRFTGPRSFRAYALARRRRMEAYLRERGRRCDATHTAATTRSGDGQG